MSHPDPPLVWVEPPPRPAAPVRPGGRPRWWMLALTLLWVAVLVAGIGWAELHPRPTDREQTTVAQARPVADAAMVQVARAAVADGQAVAVVSGFDRVGSCNVDVVRGGERYHRVVTVLVTPGTEEALMRRVAARLPASFDAAISSGPTFFADAGLFVSLVGTAAVPGRVRFVADTGDCRPAGDLAALADPQREVSASRAAMQPVLARLSLTPVSWHTYQVDCGGGAVLSTVEAVGPDGSGIGRDLSAGLRGQGAPVVSSPEIYAYRVDGLAVAARTDNDRLIVTATAGC